MSTSITAVTPPIALDPTPIAAHQLQAAPDLPIASYCGAQTIHTFSKTQEELPALIAGSGIYDLGYRAFVRIVGSDRIRWTNGMVTNTIVGLEEGQGNYSFLLNAQGRILGDATIYRFSDHLLLETDRSQLAAILAHLDHFIIMDDVELQPLDASTTALGIAGPHAPQILSKLGLATPPENQLMLSKWQSAQVHISRISSPLLPRFVLRVPSADAPALWSSLAEAGAVSCGSRAIESLRILEGAPLYGVDITDRHLPQETAQTQALNFSKGCYLGQEIVERIRSRATVHRTFRQFSLSQPLPAIEAGQTLPLEAEGAQQNPVGQLSSVAEYHLPSFTGVIGLGFIRAEILERKLPVTCNGVTVEALHAPPAIA